MLRTTRNVHGYSVQATDGSIGHVSDAYFDDAKWGVRYLVVETGPWLFGRTVLVSPQNVVEIHDEDEAVEVSLTKESVKTSPDVDTAKPISQLKEEEFHRHHQIPVYWGGTGLWGYGVQPGDIPSTRFNPTQQRAAPTADEVVGPDYHLRSAEELAGYAIEADGELVGRVESLIFETPQWAVRFLSCSELNDGNGRLLLDRSWLRDIDWLQSKVQVSVSREAILSAPTLPPDAMPGEQYERQLFDHFNSRSR